MLQFIVTKFFFHFCSGVSKSRLFRNNQPKQSTTFGLNFEEKSEDFLTLPLLQVDDLEELNTSKIFSKKRKKNRLPSKMSKPSTFSLAFEDNHNEREIQDPEVPIESVAMATKMEDVWNWLGYSRNSEMPLASVEIPVNNIVDNFQGAMELMPQEVEVLADKVTKLQHLPFTNASDQEILQFEEILSRNTEKIIDNENFLMMKM